MSTDLTCLSCAAPAPAGAAFCEACGHDLTAPTPIGADSAPEPAPAPATANGCHDCGAPVDGDGYCTSCGAKAPPARDHLVQTPQPWVAAVSDRGRRHHRNEDAMAISAGPEPGGRAALVVCDGVSSASDSDVASLAAARAACEVLTTSHARGLGTPDALTAALAARLQVAVSAASAAVAEITDAHPAPNPPSCTFVASVLDGGQVVTAVIGDSRAYWLPDDGAPLALTVDDSWAAEQIAAGVPREEAETGPQAHAITRWLGVDAPIGPARVTSMQVRGAGWLLVCSDGLWNYCSTAEDLADLVRRTSADGANEPLALAERLVGWANEQGGRDNITVALARLVTIS